MSIDQNLERLLARIESEHANGQLSPHKVYMLVSKLDSTLRRLRFPEIVKNIMGGYEDEVFTYTNRQRIIKAVRRHFIGRGGRTNSPATILKTARKICPDLVIDQSELIQIIIAYVISKGPGNPISIQFKFSQDDGFQPIPSEQTRIPGIDWERYEV